MPKHTLFTCDRCGEEKRVRPSRGLPKTWRRYELCKPVSGINTDYKKASSGYLCSECSTKWSTFMSGLFEEDEDGKT